MLDYILHIHRIKGVCWFLSSSLYYSKPQFPPSLHYLNLSVASVNRKYSGNLILPESNLCLFANWSFLYNIMFVVYFHENFALYIAVDSCIQLGIDVSGRCFMCFFFSFGANSLIVFNVIFVTPIHTIRIHKWIVINVFTFSFLPNGFTMLFLSYCPYRFRLYRRYYEICRMLTYCNYAYKSWVVLLHMIISRK